MPTINGQKMACEPCIRGHRSTKCTHANERLMVPVRKPGRPLSACPHPANQQCACGSVTAAIPRKQQCGCGTESSAAPAISSVVPQHLNSSCVDAPSPTKVTFRVQKPSSKPTSRKQSFDPSNFARIDMNSVNILPFEQHPNGMSPPIPNGYPYPGPPLRHGYPPPQYAQIQPQYGYVSMQPVPIHAMGGPVQNGWASDIKNESYGYSSLEHVVESPLATPTAFPNGTSNAMPSGGSCCAPKQEPSNEVSNGSNESSDGGLCCAPKQPSNGASNGVYNASTCCAPKLTHSQTSSTASSISEPSEPKAGGCCSSKPPQVLKLEPMPKGGSPPIPHQLSPQESMSLFPQYMSHPTVFTYPATYGSYQHPLQPSEWRQSVQTHSYVQPHAPPEVTPFSASQVSETLDTVHTCGCGDACQCIGCAAHPYNDATQEYVRSAWASMSLEGQTVSPEVYTNSHSNNVQNIEGVASPVAAQTPSSTNSQNGDEQSLSASDFFFVNYPFASDGCGGETQSCPCGDDCECLGCTIHRGPNIPCPGERSICPCGDDCECIGCTIHNGGSV